MFAIDLNNQSPVRYDLSRFQEFLEGVYDPLSSSFLDTLTSLPVHGTFTVSLDEVNRPDNLSDAIYRDTQYWWLILHYNGLLGNTDLTLGRSIRYFSLDDLENFFLTLKQVALGRTVAT